MSGDYSRNGFDPLLDDLGVLLQQGRPLTDRDWNDLVQQLSRRTHAGTLDTIGPAAVPTQTPDAFKITGSGANLSIARGRMYVDGLLAENHGAPPANTPLSWDPRLAEQFGSDALHYSATDYTAQPYYPNPPALPTTAGPHLVYLDVWQREVTHTMRPALIDRALGIDTTTRLQTVWQVKVLGEGGSGVTCSTPLETVPGWLPQNAPSAGRLSTTTAQVPGQPDPCDVPPAGGYKGKENQLYRVEIHDGGAPGTATFKWSRDDASIETAVTAIPTLTQLVGDRVVWDALRRFSSGDWIEVTDDRRELHGEPGILVQIKTPNGVDDATRTITLANQLPPLAFPTNGQGLTDPLRHTRIRRWDQKGKVFDDAGTEIADPNLANGRITVPGDGTQRLLEQGIVVDFSVEPVGGLFRTGDFWVFAARAGDATIEELKEAPPRGVHHHYAKLGIWHPGSDPDDCRIHWPPECGGCSTVTVVPGEDIQPAVDSLGVKGGCVCLKTGVHQISAPIKIQTSNIILRGESPGTIVRSPGTQLLMIGGGQTSVSDVAIESIRFEATGGPEVKTGVILVVEGCSRLRVEHCQMAAAANLPGTYTGAALNYVVDVRLTRNELKNLACGVQVGGESARVDVTLNHMQGLTTEVTGGGSTGGSYGVLINGEVEECRIEANVIRFFKAGIEVGPETLACRVMSNAIHRSALEPGGTVPSATDALRKYLDGRLYAIDVGGSGCDVRDNYVDLLSSIFGGIRSSGARTKIAGNVLEAEYHGKETGFTAAPAGIYCAPGKEMGAAHGVALHHNRLRGPQVGLVVSRVDSATVAANRVDGLQGLQHGWYGVLVDDCREACVEDNDIRNVTFGVHLNDGELNRLRGNRVRQSVSGITAFFETGLEVCESVVHGCSALGIALLLWRSTTLLLHNRITNCCYLLTDPFFGVWVFDLRVLGLGESGDMLRVEECDVVDIGISPDGAEVSTPAVGGIGAWVPACQIVGNRVGYTQPQKLDAGLQHRALLLMGPLALHVETTPGEFLYTFGTALVNANQFRGPSGTALVEFRNVPVSDIVDFRFEKATFSNNICEHLSAVAHGASVQLLGAQVIAMGNHVNAQNKAVSSMSLGGGHKNVLMGNVTTGQYINTGTVIPLPINSFNVFI